MSIGTKKNAATALSSEDVIKLYEQMLLMRRFEERCGQAYSMGYIGGFCHLYIGQEAVAVATYKVKQKDDQVVTSYRDHPHIILAGTDPKYVMAELFGKAAGCSKGKGGSMHLFDVENKFYGGHGIVGAQVSIGTGLGFANKYKNNDAVSIVFFGDGAAHQGQVYESFNMAKLWGLPVVYVIENNQYAMGTSLERSSSVADLYKRGESFGIKGVQMNGMDVLESIKTMSDVIEEVRRTKTPMLVEAKTYRYRGHSMSDPAKYRTKEELTDYKDNRDPIVNLQKLILDRKFYTQEKLDEIDQNVSQIALDAVEFAKASPEPDLSELFTDVFK